MFMPKNLTSILLCPMFIRVDQNGVWCEASDVYSFGVFLWELITGREASHIDGLGSNESMLHWVCKRASSLINIVE